MDWLLNVDKAGWLVTEGEALWAAETTLDTAFPELPTIRRLLVDRCLSTVTIRIEADTLVRFETDSSMRLMMDPIEDRITRLDPDAQDSAGEYLAQLNSPLLNSDPKDAALQALVRLLQAPGDSSVVRIELDKHAFIKGRLPQHPSGLMVWLNGQRFKEWFSDLATLRKLELLGGLDPLCVASPETLPDLSGYRFGHVPLRQLFSPEPAGWLKEYQAYQGALRNHQDKLKMTSTAPILLPEAFDLQNVFALSEAVLPAAAYALFTSFAQRLVLSKDDVISVEIAGATGPMIGAITVESSALKSGSKVFNITPDLVSALHRVYTKKAETMRDSSAYQAVWASALESALQGEIDRLLESPQAILQRFSVLRDRLLSSNLEKLLSALEKAHTTLNQITGQVNKDIDGLGSDVEKAILSTLTSGVVTVVGAVAKAGPLELLGPLISTVALTVYLPYLMNRLAYLEQSLARKEKDFQDALAAIAIAVGELPKQRNLLSRFEEYKIAGLEQVDKAWQWVRWLSALLYSLIVVGAFSSTRIGGVSWIALAPFVSAAAVLSSKKLRSRQWLQVIVWGGLVLIVTRVAAVCLPTPYLKIRDAVLLPFTSGHLHTLSVWLSAQVNHIRSPLRP